LNAPQTLDVDTVVSEKEFYVSAVKRKYDGFHVLSVYKALRTDDTDSWMRPVFDELSGRCYEWVSSMRHHDENMMGGYAVDTEYHVWDECPGHGYYHECATRV
jgi:hypothetical protein